MINIDLSAKKPVYHLFELNGKKYILDYRNLFYSELDDILFSLFRYVQNGNINELYGADSNLVSAEETIVNLYNNGIFFTEKTALERQEYEDAYISLAPVHNCNLRCKYCFAEHGNNYSGDTKCFSNGNLIQALEFLYLHYFKGIKKFRIDFVSGGEPLMAFDVIGNVIEFCEKMQRDYGITSKFWLCTNGTICEDKYFRILDKKKFNIGLSLDGPKEVHNKNRIFPSGKGSYENVKMTYEYIQSNNDFSRNFKNIWGLVVITGQTNSLVEILKHHRQMGFNNIQMKIVRSVDPELTVDSNNLEKIKRLYNELFEFFVENIQDGDSEHLKMIVNDNDYFGKIIRRLIIRTVVANRCQAGKNKVSLTADGKLYPCDSFVGNESFVIGDALKGVKKSDNSICNVFCSDRESCKECWARYLCGGDCFHNSLLKNGNHLIPDETFCKLEKHLIELSVALLCELNMNAPQLYVDLKKRLEMELKTR